MLGALVQFFGVILLSGFWQIVMVRNAFYRLPPHLRHFTALFYFPGKADETMFDTEFPEEFGIRADCTFVVGDDCGCSRLFRI